MNIHLRKPFLLFFGILVIGSYSIFNSYTAYQSATEQEQKAMLLFNQRIKHLKTKNNLEQLTRQQADFMTTINAKKLLAKLSEEHLKDYFDQQEKKFSYFKYNPVLSQKAPMTCYRVTFNIKTLLDSDFFSFIDNLYNKAPGIVSVKQFMIKQTNQLNQNILQEIATGKNSFLFIGDIDSEVCF